MSYGGGAVALSCHADALGYNQPPPPGQYPPQGHSPYPQQNQYPPPQQGQAPMNYQQYPNQGPPPGQYPQQQYGYQQGPPPGQGYAQGPPPGQYPQQQGYPPQNNYGPPPGQYGAPQYPPQGQYGAPQGQYGAPPGQYGAPPGYPPTQQYGPPALPSLGYDPSQFASINTSQYVDGLYNAMKGLGTRERELSQTLARIPDPVIMATVRRDYQQKYRQDLLARITSETSEHYRDTCEAVVRGPLAQDVHLLKNAMKGAGTNEKVLNDILLGRSNADMRAIKQAYHQTHHRQLEDDVKGDLSAKTEKLFLMVLAANRAEESAPVDPQQVERDVETLYNATIGTRFGTKQEPVCDIFATRSDGQLRAISQRYHAKYRDPLAKVIKKEFSGHMEDALLRMLHLAEDRAMADAMSLEESMKGMGTKDILLLNRVVRLHWNRDHMGQVKGAFRHHMKRDLVERIRSDTSGDYEQILVALVG